ncbi:methylated-DNA--[protein]-cysteine S-methyltransferase [Lactobacillus sp. ESL0791]|uniref:methylated-DNA--[protein]-cysteine S-methyltransferase n=1 Tax=Lactobacillus sp. ESL0791 TaxID=2983234 RepID=UPI0023F9FCFD|nr:methylated-DNA--[protein]-cysteine S-methyltransferase [Lactobacillus sp. ESL0791]MDF7638132.1 methylated-DNA--[protein]-cysteine S-methyltransferase [Lactobacillus sp. ESL0791]
MTFYYDYLQIGSTPYCLAADTSGLVYVGKKNDPKYDIANFYPNEEKLLHDSQMLAPYIRELTEYFSGKRQKFTVPINISKFGTPWQRQVLEHVAKIPYGKTISYGSLAQAVGKPLAVRAVAHAVARNPVPFFIPCHRVILTSGQIGNYRLGPEEKRQLINLEKSYL